MKNLQRVHFVGIGGVGMSGLAQHLLGQGCVVSGSDRQANNLTAKLQTMGAKVNIPHNANSVHGAQLVVRTSAVPCHNCEVKQAEKEGIPVVLRQQLLGQIFDSFPCKIAICGSHGKTTVTAMVHHILHCCGIAHTAFIGGEYQGSNYFGGGNVVVAEACEYNKSFLHMHPSLCVCLNAELDHPDCYSSEQQVRQAFEQFFAQSDNVVSFGNAPIDKNSLPGLVAKKVQCLQYGAEFEVENCPCTLQVLGKHNVQNALAALSAAKWLGVDLPCSTQALGTFCGVDRRWTERWGKLHTVCDYAHHPTEIAAALRTASEVAKGKVVCVFQPHTFSRTKALFDQFEQCFAQAHCVVFLPTFAARESAHCGTTSFKLFQAVKRRQSNVHYFADANRVANFLLNNFTKQDLVLLVGAGNVNQLAQLL